MKNFSDNIVDPTNLKAEVKRLRRLIWVLFITNLTALSGAMAALYYVHHVI